MGKQVLRVRFLTEDKANPQQSHLCKADLWPFGFPRTIKTWVNQEDWSPFEYQVLILILILG